DYKTGSMNDARRGMAQGLYFQLPLYGLAIEKLLGEGHEFLGGAYYVVNEEKGAKTEEALCAKEDARLLGIKRARSFLAETREDLSRFVRRVRDRAFEIRGHILRGKFHPTIHGPAAAGCDYCAYRFACRVDHERMETLDAEGLELLELLSEPGEESS
ncbi:MAG: PD-(D/E)XK nuclease family protein, partial [Bdellovibrionota bacterium]